METIKLFIKEKQVNIVSLEKDLGLPARTIRMDRDIPKRFMGKLVEYLRKNYDYPDGVQAEAEADVPGTKPVMKKVWNKNFIPNYKDGILRYQDPENGLWKRLMIWQSSVVKETGEIKMNEQFLPASKEIYTDKLGRFYVAKNGIKVYKFDKEIAAKK